MCITLVVHIFELFELLNYYLTHDVIIYYELFNFSLAIYLYKNILNLMPTNNVCLKNDHLWL